MTELERPSLPSVGAVSVAGAAPTAAQQMIHGWAMTLADAHAIAEAFVDTAFMPDSYKPRLDPRASVEEVAAARTKSVQTGAAAIMHGAAIGFEPLAALQNVIIISGRPSLYAEAMVALLVAHGHQVWVEELTDTRAVVCGRRAGSAHEERATVTMDQAKRAGWTRNQKYQSEPQAMLYARAASRVCRFIAPDVLKGIAAAEDLQDAADDAPAPRAGVTPMRREQPAEIEGGPAERPPAKKATTTRRKSAPPSSDADAVDTERPPVPGDDPQEPAESRNPAQESGGGITEQQMKKLHASFSEHGITKREFALAYCFDVIGREIESTKELSKDEASQVIDHLAKNGADAGGRPPFDEPNAEPDPRDETEAQAQPDDTAAAAAADETGVEQQ
jgi:hypothetical protein